MRLGEKETLESTLKFFDDRIERLSDLEYYQVRPDSIFIGWCMADPLPEGHREFTGIADHLSAELQSQGESLCELLGGN